MFYGFGFSVFQRNTLWVGNDAGDSLRSVGTHCACIEICYLHKTFRWNVWPLSFIVSTHKMSLRDKENRGFYLEKVFPLFNGKDFTDLVLCVPAEHIMGRK
jgi:hypothetical protein